MKYLIIAGTLKEAHDFKVKHKGRIDEFICVTKPHQVEGYFTHQQPVGIIMMPRAYQNPEWERIREGLIRSFLV